MSVCDFVLHKTLCKFAFCPTSMILPQIMQFHKLGGYKLQIQTQKSKHNNKCPLYVDFIIIINNNELMRANFLGFLCHNNGVIQTYSYNSQSKASVQILGPRAQLKQTLISIMVTQNKINITI